MKQGLGETEGMSPDKKFLTTHTSDQDSSPVRSVPTEDQLLQSTFKKTFTNEAVPTTDSFGSNEDLGPFGVKPVRAFRARRVSYQPKNSRALGLQRN